MRYPASFFGGPSPSISDASRSPRRWRTWITSSSSAGHSGSRKRPSSFGLHEYRDRQQVNLLFADLPRVAKRRAELLSGHQDDYPDNHQDHTKDESAGASHTEPENGLAEALSQRFLRAVADDETMALFTRLWGSDPTTLLHGAEHVDRLVDGKYALGVAVADRALSPAKVDTHPSEREGSLVPRVPVETVHHLPGVHLGALRIDRYSATVVLHYEWRELYVLGDHLRAPVRPDVVVVVIVVGPQVFARNRRRVVGAGLLGHLAGKRVLAAQSTLDLNQRPRRAPGYVRHAGGLGLDHEGRLLPGPVAEVEHDSARDQEDNSEQQQDQKRYHLASHSSR